MTQKYRVWKEVALWLLVAMSLYPAISAINLLLLSLPADTLVPTLMATVSKRYLAFSVIEDWLASLPVGAIFALMTVAVPALILREKRSITLSIVISALLLLPLCYLIYGTHFTFYLAPLLFGLITLAAYFLLIGHTASREQLQ